MGAWAAWAAFVVGVWWEGGRVGARTGGLGVVFAALLEGLGCG